MAATKKQHPTLVRIRGTGDGGHPPVFEHRCYQNPVAGGHSFKPKIMWCQPWSSKASPVWCLTHRDSRLPIQTCPFCDENLKNPFGYECTCGAETVRLARGRQAFEVEHDFVLRDGSTHHVRALVYVESYLHDPTCRAARFVEEDAQSLF